MQRNNRQPPREFSSFIGKRTPAKQAGLTYSVSALAFFAVSVVLLFFSGKAATAENPPQWFLYLNFLAAPIAFALVAVWYFQSTKTPLKTFCKEQVCHPKYYLIALLLQVGLLSLGELNSLFLQFLERFGYEDSGITLPSVEGVGFFGVFLVIAVLPAFMEELFFRGIFQRDMKELSTWAQVLLCGGMFALYHQNPAQTVYQFICGGAFALVAVRAGSFLPTVLAHFINNGAVVILYKLGVESYPLPMYVIMLIISGICLGGTLLYLTLFDKKNTEKKRTRKGALGEFFLYASVGIAVFAVSWVIVLFMGL